MRTKTKTQSTQPATPPILPGSAEYVAPSHQTEDLYIFIPVGLTSNMLMKLGTGWIANQNGVRQVNEAAAKGWRIVSSTAHMVIMASPEIAA